MITKEIEASKKSINKETVFRLAISLLLAGSTAWWSIPYALAVRGYFAIGGEHFLIVVMGALPWLSQGTNSMLKETIDLWSWSSSRQPHRDMNINVEISNSQESDDPLRCIE